MVAPSHRNVPDVPVVTHVPDVPDVPEVPVVPVREGAPTGLPIGKLSIPRHFYYFERSHTLGS